MRPEQKPGSKSILSEFVDFIKLIQKKGCEMKGSTNKIFFRHHFGQHIEMSMRDEHTAVITLYGYGNIAQRVRIFARDPNAFRDVRIIILRRNEKFEQAAQTKHDKQIMHRPILVRRAS